MSRGCHGKNGKGTNSSHSQGLAGQTAGSVWISHVGYEVVLQLGHRPPAIPRPPGKGRGLFGCSGEKKVAEKAPGLILGDKPQVLQQIDAAGPDECRVELGEVVGSQEHNPPFLSHHLVQHTEQSCHGHLQGITLAQDLQGLAQPWPFPAGAADLNPLHPPRRHGMRADLLEGPLLRGIG